MKLISTLTTVLRTLAPMAAIALASMAMTTLAGCGGVSGEDPAAEVSSAKAKDDHGHADEKLADGDGAHTDDAPSSDASPADDAGEVRMTPEAIREAGIEVAAVVRQPVTTSVTAPGRVVPTQNGAAHVGTIIPGRITRLYVSEGSRVSRGTVLAELEAFEVGQLKGDVVTARAVVEQTRSAVARQERLEKENIGARKNLEDARAAYSTAVAGLRAAEARLRTVGIEPASVGSGSFTSRIAIRSPIAGVVSRRNVVLGEYLEESKDAFEVVNTAVVWIDAQVPPDVAAALSVGSTGFIEDAANHRHSGSVRFISPTVDSESRTVTVRIEVDNPDVHLRPETFATVEFERGVSGAALSLPKSAFEQEGSNYYVYREHEAGVFERVLVDLGAESGDRRVIRSGLRDGERVAISGLFYLKATRLRGGLSEHHH